MLDVHIAEPLVPDCNSFGLEITTAKLKKYKLPYSNQIPAEMNQAAGETLSEIYKFIDSIWNKKELHDQAKEYIYFTRLQEG
jgi:hypothetical protein